MANYPKESNAVSGGYYMANLDSIAEFLADNGYSKAAAAGIAGTIAGESGGNPESVGSGGAGLIANTPPISGEISGNAQKDFDFQLNELLQYANANSSEAVARGGVDLNTLKQATSPAQAASWWSAFEGPLNPGSDVRSGVANQVYNDISNFTPGGQYTQPSSGGAVAQGGGTTGNAAILDAFPGGIADPLNWPSEAAQAAGGGIAGEITSGIGNGIESAVEGIFGNIMTNLGFKSGKDFLIRAALILAGFIILIIGIKAFASPSSVNTSGSSLFSGDGDQSGDGEERPSDEKTAGGNSPPARRSSVKGSEAAQTRRSAVGRPSPSTSHRSKGTVSPQKVLGRDAIKAAVIA